MNNIDDTGVGVRGCAGIILAAGASTRLGQPKQLVRLGGESLLRRAIRIATEAGCAAIFLVLGEDASTLATEAEGTSANIVVNTQWATGMASSLKSGLAAALQEDPSLSAIMVLVCDQPLLDVAVLHNLMAAYETRRAKITASQYGGALGVPAIFSREVFPELMALSGDQGARRVLKQHLREVVSIDFPGGEFDLDTPADLARLFS